jgi:hypothetical protein
MRVLCLNNTSKNHLFVTIPVVRYKYTMSVSRVAEVCGGVRQKLGWCSVKVGVSGNEGHVNSSSIELFYYHSDVFYNSYKRIF